MAAYWLDRGSKRNYAVIVVGSNSAFRMTDLLSLKWSDVYDKRAGAFRGRVAVRETKTRKTRSVAIDDEARGALALLMAGRRDECDYIFDNGRKGKPSHICREHARRIINEAAEAVDAMPEGVPCSLRKTFGYHAWKGGASPVILVELYNHSSYETTRRYLGVTQDDMDRVHLGLGLFRDDPDPPPKASGRRARSGGSGSVAPMEAYGHPAYDANRRLGAARDDPGRVHPGAGSFRDAGGDPPARK